MVSDASIAKLAGVIVEGSATGLGTAAIGGVPQALDPNSYVKTRISAAQYIRMFGVPEFVDEAFRRNSLYVGTLDPDIAAKKSWSMSVKILTQRQRNYERQLEFVQHTARHHKMAAAFKTLTGWDWPF